MVRETVILRDDHLGDMILTTPLARSLAQAGHRVAVVGKRAWAPVWEHNPHAVYQPIEDLCPAWPSGWMRLARWLRDQKAEAVLVPYRHSRLLASSLFSGARRRLCQSGRWIGRLTLHECLRSRLHERPRHMADVWLDFARVLDVAPGSPQPELHLTEAERAWAASFWAAKASGNATRVVVHPFHGASTCHPELPFYASVAGRLAAAGCAVVVTGSPVERGAWEAVSPPPEVSAAVGALNLRQFMAVIGGADALVCGSTGALHIASALGVPTASIFCPHPAVGPALWSSFAPGSEVLAAPLETCVRCKDSRRLNCGMKAGPGVEQVVEAVLRLTRAPAHVPTRGQ